MKDYAPRSTNEAYWLRDAADIENSQALVLIGSGQGESGGLRLRRLRFFYLQGV